ncbi:MAG: glycosyltransferase family 4 protein [Pirellulaceae bacterium]|nr:glycosyltransferase family 4 protein [Planctomycetales bacterium]
MAHVCILSSVHIALDNRVFFREAQSLVRLGHQVTLIAKHDREEIRDGVRIVPLPSVSIWRRWLVWSKLFRLARRTRADLYLFHDPELLAVTPWLRWSTRKPTVYDVHEVYPDFIRIKDHIPGIVRVPFAWVFEWLEPLLARLQSGLLFADNQIAHRFRRLGCPKSTLFNFPASDFVSKAAGASRSHSQRPLEVVYVGGIERNRGAVLMIEAFHRVLQAIPDARLKLVGNIAPDNLRGDIERAIDKFGVRDKVKLTGRIPFDQIGCFLSDARVGWVAWQPLPKNQKNIPTKLFEYMSYGAAIVSSRLDSTQPFVLEGENGLLVDATDPQAHANAIIELLSNPQRSDAMGRRGQELVKERWNWSEMEARLGHFVDVILQSSERIDDLTEPRSHGDA